MKVHGERLTDPIAFKRIWPKASDEEVEELKRDWRRDPHWDIEGTQGFEHQYGALRAFRESIATDQKMKEMAEREARVVMHASHVQKAQSDYHAAINARAKLVAGIALFTDAEHQKAEARSEECRRAADRAAAQILELKAMQNDAIAAEVTAERLAKDEALRNRAEVSTARELDRS